MHFLFVTCSNGSRHFFFVCFVCSNGSRHFLFVCSNGSCRRHREIFNEVEFVVELISQKISRRPPGEVKRWLSFNGISWTTQKNVQPKQSDHRIDWFAFGHALSVIITAFDTSKPLGEPRKGYLNIITNYPCIFSTYVFWRSVPMAYLRQKHKITIMWDIISNYQQLIAHKY